MLSHMVVHLRTVTLSGFDSKPLLAVNYSGNVRPLFIQFKVQDEHAEQTNHRYGSKLYLNYSEYVICNLLRICLLYYCN